jgi:hypothetical protein
MIITSINEDGEHSSVEQKRATNDTKRREAEEQTDRF